jgi:hypothetical protein
LDRAASAAWLAETLIGNNPIDLSRVLRINSNAPPFRSRREERHATLSARTT